jgi:transposase
MMQPVVRRTWSPTGKTPIICPSWSHARWSIIGALTIAPRRQRLGFYFLGRDQNATGDHFVEFLKILQRQLRRPVTVVWDGLGGHKKAARLLAQDARFQFEFLPACAPELNPVEGAWSWCKFGQLANYCPDSFAVLRETLINTFHTLRRKHSHLHGFFHGCDLSLA